MKILNISGGGTKIIGEFGAAEALYEEHGWKADVITGISAGAIIALPIAMGKFAETKELLMKLKYSHFFKHVPVKKDGSLRIWSIVRFALKWMTFQKPRAIGDFVNVEKTLKELISLEEFQMWQQNSRTDVWVGSVSFSDGSRQYHNLREMSYAMAMTAIRASASIPVFCQPVKQFDNHSGKYHWTYDGGVRDFIASVWVLEHYGADNVTETVDIFSKPMDNKVLEYDNKRVNSLVKVFMAVITIMQVEISKNDEGESEAIGENAGVQMWAVYLPNVLYHVYDIDHVRLKRLYQYGYREGKNLFANLKK
jgi:predicted acylesterase/phospholipase RssA